MISTKINYAYQDIILRQICKGAAASLSWDTVRLLQGILRELLEQTVVKQKIPEQQVFVPKQLSVTHAENTITRKGYKEKAAF